MPSSRILDDDIEDLLHHERRKAHGRLVEHDQRGRAMSARAMASICCSPPESVPASWSSPLLQDREQAVHVVQVAVHIMPVSPLELDVGAEQKVLLHRHGSEHLPAFGHERAAAEHDLARSACG